MTLVIVLVSILVIAVGAAVAVMYRLSNSWTLLHTGKVTAVSHVMGERPDLWVTGLPFLVMMSIPQTVLQFEDGDEVTLDGRFEVTAGDGRTVAAFVNGVGEYRVDVF